MEPLLDLCEEHFTTETIDRATDLLLVLLRGDEAQKELYVALNIVNLVIKIIAHCSMNMAKENAVVILRCEQQYKLHAPGPHHASALRSHRGAFNLLDDAELRMHYFGPGNEIDVGTCANSILYEHPSVRRSLIDKGGYVACDLFPVAIKCAHSCHGICGS